MNPENKKPVYGLWVIFTVFGFFNVILYYYAGIKSKSGKYIKIGHFYLLLIFLSSFMSSNNLFIRNIVFYLYLGGYIFGLIFAVKNLPAYRKRITMLKQLDHVSLSNKKIYPMNNQSLENFIQNSSSAALKNNINTSVFDTSENSDSGTSAESIEDEYLDYNGEKIKINIDPEEKLSALPFITEELVRKIILERKLGSGFKNENDLRNKLGLNERNTKILVRRIDFSFEK